MGQRIVNGRQLDVLKWIGDGCPPGVMTGTAYKTTALASQNRRLAKVTRRCGVWAVTLTDAGRYFLGHAAYPAGHFSDKVPKKHVLIVGYALGAITNVLLFLAYDTKVGMVCAVVLSGVYIAIEETVEKAAVADSLPKEKRTLGFGVLAGANAVGDMVSSIYVGLLLDSAHPERAFAVAATLSFLGTLFIGFVAPRPKT